MATKKPKITKPAVEPEKKESKFSKVQLVKAKRFEDRRDVVNAVLAAYPDYAEFTVKAVEEMIENFLKDEVK